MSKAYESRFRIYSVRLALSSSQPIFRTADDLGIKHSTLYNWISRSRAKPQGSLKESNSEINMSEALTRLRKENMRLKEELDILCSRIKVKFGFMKSHSKLYSVSRMSKVLEVSTAGHYAWLNRAEGRRR